MSDPHHFIRNFEAQPGCFIVYMALVLAAGDITKPPTTQHHVKIKWLEDETRFYRRKIMEAIRHMKNKEVLFTEERLDTIYYRFIYPTHAQIIEKVYAVRAPVVKATKATQVRNVTTHYYHYIMSVAKDKNVNMPYCINKIRMLVNEFKARKLSETEIDHYFRTLAHKVSTGANLEILLSPDVQAVDPNLTKTTKKVVGW